MQIPESCLDNPKLPVTHAQGDWVKIAQDLFVMCMESLQGQDTPEGITDYTLHRVMFSGEELWGYLVYAEYSVQSDGDYYEAGNGEIGDDGWVNNKVAFIPIYRDQDHFIIASQWSTSP
jgi:hypothetical protein